MGGDKKDKDAARRKQARAIGILQWFAGQEVNPRRVLDRKHRDRDTDSERRGSSRHHHCSSDRPSTASTVTATTMSEWSSTTATKNPTRSKSHRDKSTKATAVQEDSEDDYGPPSPPSSVKQTRIRTWAADVNPGAPAPPSTVGRSDESVATNRRASKPASRASTLYPSDAAVSIRTCPATASHGGSQSPKTQASSSRQGSRCPTTAGPSNHSSRHDKPPCSTHSQAPIAVPSSHSSRYDKSHSSRAPTATPSNHSLRHDKSRSSVSHSQAPDSVSIKSHPATHRGSNSRLSSETQAPPSSSRSAHHSTAPGSSLCGGDGGSIRGSSRTSGHTEGRAPSSAARYQEASLSAYSFRSYPPSHGDDLGRKRGTKSSI